MIRFSAAGVEFRLHVLAILMAALGACLGISAVLIWVLVALFVHETAHIVAARLCGVEIEYIEIMPFGGAAHVKELYSVGGVSLAVVALAGPFANGLMMLAAGALGWWRILDFDSAMIMARINGGLMLFNLVPALPLDGGRVLYAALRGPLGRRRAVNIAAGIAYALAGCLVAAAVFMWMRDKMVNVSLVIMAVFLVASGCSERASALDEGAQRAVRGMSRVRELPERARIVALDADRPISQAARYIGGRETTIFAMMRDGRFMEFVGEGDAATRMMKGAER